MSTKRDCDKTLELAVNCCAHGWYIGYSCHECGYWSRESGYYLTEQAARFELARLNGQAIAETRQTEIGGPVFR